MYLNDGRSFLYEICRNFSHCDKFIWNGILTKNATLSSKSPNVSANAIVIGHTLIEVAYFDFNFNSID